MLYKTHKKQVSIIESKKYYDFCDLFYEVDATEEKIFNAFTTFFKPFDSMNYNSISWNFVNFKSVAKKYFELLGLKSNRVVDNVR